MSSSTILRVRELLPQLSYGELVAYNLIPDLVDLLEKEGDPILFKSIRFPKFVYSSAKEGIPHFGVQMEHIVRTYLATPTEGASTAVKVALAQVGLGTTSKADWKAYLSRFGLPGLLRELEQNWKSVPFLRKGGGPAYEVELQEDGVQGHPDIVVETAVLDVKTTTSLKKMLPEACLQILAYFVLGKANGLPFRHAGLVLPMQRRVVTFDLARWESWRDYLAILHQRARIMTAGTALDLVTLGWQLTYVRQEGDLYHNPAYKLGTHVGITKIGFVEALRSYGKQRPGLPCQLFLQSPTGGSSSERYLPVKDLEEAASLISIYQLTYFTHSPYVINMCKPEPWHLVTLKRELEQTARIGGRGCVVHTGARKELSMAAALDAMAWVVADVAPFASPECRLLLETPAKEGTDTLNTVEEMGQFLSGRFPASIRDRIGICVDTAHVWAAGYNPLDYLQTLERRYPTVYIGLIHFNGSRVKRGSRRDAHWPAGSKGDYIGMATMVAVAAWAAARSVPLVTE